MLLFAETIFISCVFSAFEVVRRFKNNRYRSTITLDEISNEDIQDAKLIY